MTRAILTTGTPRKLRERNYWRAKQAESRERARQRNRDADIEYEKQRAARFALRMENLVSAWSVSFVNDFALNDANEGTPGILTSGLPEDEVVARLRAATANLVPSILEAFTVIVPALVAQGMDDEAMFTYLDEELAKAGRTLHAAHKNAL